MDTAPDAKNQTTPLSMSNSEETIHSQAFVNLHTNQNGGAQQKLAGCVNFP
ncbi:hypothetical protein AN958_11833 [Leucoagaricus sp. SymC.cos]|nr:hypothetical protein AN958_11833 [Leucoagaricus sp. SymC.cos]